MAAKYALACLEAAEPRSVCFPVAPLADESLTGLIARTCAENVLGRTRSLLAAAGLSGNSAPAAAVEADAGALAAVLGVATSEVRQRMYVPVPDQPGPFMMTFFGTTIRAVHRHACGRRVSPGALRHSLHHRALWDLKPITFCPETWELLVEDCLACQQRPGWSRTDGIALCEHCGADLRCVEPDTVAACDRPALAFASGLLDPRAGVRAAALAQVPPGLAGVASGTLFELALALGEVHDAARRDHGLAPAPAHAKLARGAELVLGWPEALGGLLREEQARLTHAARSSRAWRRFKRLMWDRWTVTEVRGLLHEAYRHLLADMRAFPQRARDERRAKGLLTAREVARRLRVSASDVARLREAGVLRPLPVGGRLRQHGWLAETGTEEVGRALANRMSPEAITQQYGLRRPSLEQLVRCGHIRVNEHAAVRTLHPGLQLDATSVADFFATVAARIEPATNEHRDWVPLARLMRIIGGREKPVAAVLEAVLGGTILLAAASSERGFNYARLLAPREASTMLQALAASPDTDDTEAAFPRAAHLSDVEAMEHLNCNPREFYRSVKSRLVDGDRIPRSAVEEFGELYISSIELTARTGLPATRLASHLRRWQLVELPGGFWERGRALRLAVPVAGRRSLGVQLAFWPAESGALNSRPASLS